MPIINKGTSFANGEQLTADKINNLLDLAEFNQSATDSASTTVNSASQIIVRDSGVTTAKLATDAVETAKIKDANVTKAKIEDVADYKVLGNVSGATAAPAEVSILDEDDMTSDSATALATQQSIKAYVDATAGGFTPSTYANEDSVTFPNGLIMKFGSQSVSGDSSASVSFPVSFPTGIVQVQLTYGSALPLNQDAGLSATGRGVNGFTVQNGSGGTETIHWQAIGY